MAFVYRTERNTSLSPPKDYDIGPGQYINQTDFVPSNTSKAPFLNNTKRESINLASKENPGPGTYYKDETFEKYYRNIQKEKHFNEEQLKSLKVLNNLNQMAATDGFTCVVLKNNAEHLGFLARDKRFKEMKETNQTPGPGFYVKGQQLERKIFSAKKEILFGRIGKSDINRTDKVASIPSKNQVFGYEVNEDGTVNLNDDPDIFKRFKGVKNDTVGPGNYEVVKPENWLKKGQIWGKTTSRQKKIIHTKKANCNFNKLSRSFDNLNLEDSIIKINLRRSQTAKSKKNVNYTLLNNKVRKINRKELIDEMMKKCEPVELINSKLQNNSILKDQPGPGYYFDDKKTSAFKSVRYTESKPNSQSNFQSNLRRFPEAIVADENIGPGTYFRDNVKSIEKKTKKTIPSIKENKAMMTNEKMTVETPGPGQYNPTMDFNPRRTFTNTVHFGSTEKRFVDTEAKTPGPGSYLDSYSTAMNTMYTTRSKFGGNQKDMKLMRRAVTGKIRVFASDRQEKLPEHFEKNIIPPVGTYNPDTIFSIDYNVKKNANKMTGVDIPFYSTLPKRGIYEPKKDENPKVGPGYYHKDRKPQTAQVYPPFKQNEKRFYFPRAETNIGPGNYNQSSYFDWNKKTFNILYL